MIKTMQTSTTNSVDRKLNAAEMKLLVHFEKSDFFKDRWNRWNEEGRKAFLHFANVVHSAGLDWWYLESMEQLRFGRKEDVPGKAYAVFGLVVRRKTGEFPKIKVLDRLGKIEAYDPAVDLTIELAKKIEFNFNAQKNAIENWKPLAEHAKALWPDDYENSESNEDSKYEDESYEFDNIEVKFSESVNKSSRDTTEARQSRLMLAPKKPSVKWASVKVFDRNPDVVAEVLFRATKCGACQKEAPFKKRSNGEPYFEVHHKVQLANNGEDTVENAIALCPNCHRKAHFG